MTLNEWVIKQRVRKFMVRYERKAAAGKPNTGTVLHLLLWLETGSRRLCRELAANAGRVLGRQMFVNRRERGKSTRTVLICRSVVPLCAG